MRRINIWGGPGSGKSTIAAYLFAELKIRHYNVQFVEEFIKKWAYEKKIPTSFDELFLLTQQLHLEDLYLRNGVDFIVTDCPIFLCYCFAIREKMCFAEEIRGIVRHFENTYPSLNIMLDRKGIKYQEKGRYEKHEEAIAMDDLIEGVLQKDCSNYIKIRSQDREGILDYVINKLGCN